MKDLHDKLDMVASKGVPIIAAAGSLSPHRKSKENIPNIIQIRLPLRRSQLFQTIYNILNTAPKNMSGAPAEKKQKTEGHAPKQCKILVVEDNHVNQKILVRMLTNLGILCIFEGKVIYQNIK